MTALCCAICGAPGASQWTDECADCEADADEQQAQCETEERAYQEWADREQEARREREPQKRRAVSR